jgi:glycerate dehydrogenase
LADGVPASGWHVVFLDAATLHREGDVSFEKFTARWPCTFHARTAAGETAARVAGFQVAVTNKAVLSAELLARPEAADLKLIAVTATGTNNVDLEAARRRGVAVCNVAGYSGVSVTSHTFALILELFSRVGDYARDTREGVWSRSPLFVALSYTTHDLAGKTLGIIGFGHIGQGVARVGAAFGMEILHFSRGGAPAAAPGRRVALDELLRRSDVVTVHCPLTPETRDLLGARELALMKPAACLINAARGGIVNEAALIAALREKRLAGAGLDVLTEEPPRADHPVMAAAREMPNLLVTPHVAWTTIEARQRLLDEVFQNLAAFETGGKRNSMW